MKNHLGHSKLTSQTKTDTTNTLTTPAKFFWFKSLSYHRKSRLIPPRWIWEIRDFIKALHTAWSWSLGSKTHSHPTGTWNPEAGLFYGIQVGSRLVGNGRESYIVLVMFESYYVNKDYIKIGGGNELEVLEVLFMLSKFCLVLKHPCR